MPLAGLTNLEKLNLSSNQIADLSPLANLTKLVELNLYRNPIPEDQKAMIKKPCQTAKSGSDLSEHVPGVPEGFVLADASLDRRR